MGLKSLTAIIPMGMEHGSAMGNGKGKAKADEEGDDAEPDDEGDAGGDGLRESFDELADDLDVPEDKRDAVFEKLKGFCEQVAHQCYRDEQDEPASKDEEE